MIPVSAVSQTCPYILDCAYWLEATANRQIFGRIRFIYFCLYIRTLCAYIVLDALTSKPKWCLRGISSPKHPIFYIFANMQNDINNNFSACMRSKPCNCRVIRWYVKMDVSYAVLLSMLAYFIVPCMRNLKAFTYSNLLQTSQTLQYKIGTEMKDAKVDFSSHVQGCECYIRHIRVGARKTLQINVLGAVCGRRVYFFVFFICFSVVLMTHTRFIITLACVMHTRMCWILRPLRGFFSVQVSLLHA